MIDLGVCGCFVGQEECSGRVVFTERVGVLDQGECDVCGRVAARPAPRVRVEESEERW